MASPFLKWAGGKGFVVPKLLQYVPAEFDYYHEPFFGSGAFFFALADREAVPQAVLSDANQYLMNVYKCVRDNVEGVIAYLTGLKGTYYSLDEDGRRKHYFEMRENVHDLSLEGAAMFIYINKIGFRGLYRVNSKNKFNVGYGQYKKPKIFDPDALRSVSAALQNIGLRTCDFDLIEYSVKNGDFIYMDPPYDPLSVTSHVKYTAASFTWEDQERLAEFAMKLSSDKGCYVMISNSATDRIKNLYTKVGLNVNIITNVRKINNPFYVDDVLAMSYKPESRIW